jgi:hypothetical protein
MICLCYYSALTIYHCHPYLYRVRFITLTGVYFCRLKINHDTHVFILDSGTVANNFNQKVLDLPQNLKSILYELSQA